MKIEIENLQPWTVFLLEGNLDATAGPGVYLRFQRELMAGRSQFLFDLSGVDLVDSAGLGVLVRCYRDVRGRGGELCLQKVPQPIDRILEFTRLNTIFRIADDFPYEETDRRAQAQ